MEQVWLIDFEDSFTYNIASEFKLLGVDCKVIPWREWSVPTTREPKLLVLGPGPGHPDEYGIENRLMAWWKSSVPIAGICLGHQFLARFIGLKVERSKHPVHGEAVDLKVPMNWQKRFQLPGEVKVQRYNSLGVPDGKLPQGWNAWESEGEIVGLFHDKAISYQFHPESVGTSCPRSFFLPLCRLAL